MSTRPRNKTAYGYFDAKGKPCYQLHDYRGNVAVVVAWSGNVLAHNRYYPYGETITRFTGSHVTTSKIDAGAVATAGRYRFGSKEHETMHGLNAYDFGPRLLAANIPQWDSPDRKQESYYALSPYLYCAANPIRHTDPTGEEVEFTGDEKLVKEVQNILQEMVGKSARVEINDGKVNIEPTENRDASQQEQNAVKYLEGAVKAETQISLQLVENDGNVDIADGKERKIDMTDVRNAGPSEPATPSAIIMHEIIEQYCVKLSNSAEKDWTKAHCTAINVENSMYKDVERIVVIDHSDIIVTEDGAKNAHIIYIPKGKTEKDAKYKDFRLSP